MRDAVGRVTARTAALLDVDGDLAPSHFHRELGEIMYRGVGVERTAAGLRTAIDEIRDLRHRFWHQVRVPGGGRQLNQALEKAGRIADFMELAEVMAVDALDRQESCGAHFRSEYQDEGEARRDDDAWSFASAWETHAPPGATDDLTLTRHAEPLRFESVPLATRSYR